VRNYPLCLTVVLALVSVPLGATAALAKDPVVDLQLNQAQFHLYRSGLVLPFTGEGFRKYSQEYGQPWGPIVRHENHPGRVCKTSTATLTFPSPGGIATLLVRGHGLVNGQKLSVHLNGQLLKNTDLPANWNTVAIEIPAGKLKAGENTLQMSWQKSSTVGGNKSYGLLHSVEFAPGSVAGDTHDKWPPALPGRPITIGNEKHQSLTGFSTLALFTEIPERATLSLSTGVTVGEQRLQIKAETADGNAQTLFDGTQKIGWSARKIDLGKLAGQLVRLSFVAGTADPTAVAWGDARIEMATAPAHDVPVFKNAILFVVDALRADRLSIYAKTRVATPNFRAAFEQKGIAFMHNQAASPSSPPSHGSIQTGMIPRVHGVSGDKEKLFPGTPMISTQLAAAGFATGYYGNNPFGMARLEAPGQWTEFHQPNQEGKGIDCVALVNGMIGFATQQAKAGKRFFISSLPYEPHTPYLYHPGITDKYHKGPWDPVVGKVVNGDLLGKIVSKKVILNDAQWNQLKALYDGEVEHADECYIQLMKGLEKAGIADETLFVLTADHGEGMLEHGYMGHAYGHWGEVGNVPLVFFGKGLGKGTKSTVVSTHLDIAPTLIELLGVKPDQRIQGQSLVPSIARNGAWTPRVVSLEYGRSYSLRSKDYRYIVDYGGNEMFYDLQRDPGEQKNLVETDRFGLRYLRDLTGFFLTHRTKWHTESWGDLNNHRSGFVRAALGLEDVTFGYSP
jgi:arylsulfatase A-like enzyme